MGKVIEVIVYIILGIIQGITEILPISSSAHLLIVANLFAIDQHNLSLEVLLHLGSVIAVIIYFRSQLKTLISGTFAYIGDKKKDKQPFDKLVALIIATIPAVIVGFIFKDIVERVFTNLIYVGICLLITAIILFNLKFKKSNKDKISYKDALVIGAFQAIGIIPGISRSLVCLSGASSRKIKVDVAGDFVFLLFIPIAIGSFILTLIDLIMENSLQITIPIIISMLTTIVFTYISLSLLLSLIKKGRLLPFSIYTFILGILVIIINI